MLKYIIYIYIFVQLNSTANSGNLIFLMMIFMLVDAFSRVYANNIDHSMYESKACLLYGSSTQKEHHYMGVLRDCVCVCASDYVHVIPG